MSITAIKQAVEALTDSVDLVRNEYQDAVDLYGCYPTRAARINGLLSGLKAHEDAITALRTAIQEAESVKPVAWLHDCAALLQNDVEFWIDSCPHCGKPRTHSPTTPVDDWQRDQTKPAEQRRVLEQALKALKYAGAGSYERSAAAITAIQEVLNGN